MMLLFFLLLFALPTSSIFKEILVPSPLEDETLESVVLGIKALAREATAVEQIGFLRREDGVHQGCGQVLAVSANCSYVTEVLQRLCEGNNFAVTFLNNQERCKGQETNATFGTKLRLAYDNWSPLYQVSPDNGEMVRKYTSQIRISTVSIL